MPTSETTDPVKVVEMEPLNSCADGMHAYLDSALRLHQDVLNECVQLRKNYSEQFTAGQKLMAENTRLQRKCLDLSQENEELKKQLIELTLKLNVQECRLTTGSGNLNHLHHLSEPDFLEETCLTAHSEIDGNLDAPVLAVDIPFSSASCALKEVILCPDTEHYLKSENGRSKLECPNIVIPETVPMDVAGYDEKESMLVDAGDTIFPEENTSQMKLLKTEKVLVQNLHAAENIVLQAVSGPSQKDSSGIDDKLSAEIEEPGSPVFDCFQELKNSKRQSIGSPSLFDEEDECPMRNWRKINEDSLATPMSESVMKSKTRMMSFGAVNGKEDAGKTDICKSDLDSKTVHHLDSCSYASPSVISGLPEIKNTVHQGSEGYLGHGCNNVMLNNFVTYSQNMASESWKLQNLQGHRDSCNITVCDTAEKLRKTSRFSLRKAQKENREADSVISATPVIDPDASCSRKRKRTSFDPDETYCPLQNSPPESSLCDSTHFVAPGNSVPGNDVFANCSLDSVTEVNDQMGISNVKRLQLSSRVTEDAKEVSKQICDSECSPPRMFLEIPEVNVLEKNDTDGKAMRANHPSSTPDEMEDSFDRVPKTDKINYAYVDVVRKQNQRRQLDSFACPQCKQWYDGLGLTEEEVKERLKNCRHKARFKPTATPEHYWSIEFPDTQLCKERGYLNIEHISPSKHRRKKGLRVLFESNKERLKERKRKQPSIEQCLKLTNDKPK